MLPATGDTEGAAGRPGSSLTLVRVIVTAMVSVPPLPSGYPVLARLAGIYVVKAIGDSMRVS